jgi:small-conductance mechanosensitive channel
MPPWLQSIEPYDGLLLRAVLLPLVGLAVNHFIFSIVSRFAETGPQAFWPPFARRWRRPWDLIAVLIGLRVALEDVSPDLAPIESIEQAWALAAIGAVSWAAIDLISYSGDYISRRFGVDKRDNLRERKIQTQFRVLRRIAVIAVVLIAVASMLMTFERIRQLGVSILASAGIAGIILGFAAQRSIATMLAGIQIALTQPIRLDDVVIVEGEWGWIEEIALTYVVVRVWDLRRLIVPITFFIENSFQNWTRTNADMLGVVVIHVDYKVPVDDVRAELDRILQTTDLWDGKASNVQVTDASEKSMALRAMVSASDAPKLWSLRVLVREKLIAFLQREHPDCLPKLRGEWSGAAARPAD